jgi:hypothetical protein
MSNLFDAFISYGRADSLAFGRKLQARLLEQGVKVWFDQNDIPLGVDFQNQILVRTLDTDREHLRHQSIAIAT